MKPRGITLIELIIYVAVFALVAGSFVAFGLSVSGSRNKTYVIQEVQANARLSLDVMARDIRRATDVVAPTEGNSAASLTLDVPGPDNVVYSVSGGVLYQTIGANPAQELTGARVEVTSLTFENVTPPGGRENVRITMTIAYRNDPTIDFTYSKTYQTSVSLRR